MVTAYVSKAVAVETMKRLCLLITQNMGLHTRLGRVFRSSEVCKDKFLTIEAEGRPLKAIHYLN